MDADEVFCEQIGEVINVTITAIDENDLVSTCISEVSVEGLPCGWTDDGGIGCQGGSSSYDANYDSYELTAPDCAPVSPYVADQTAFTYTELCGDGEITVFVSGVQGTGYAGIMMRESAGAGARKVAIGTNGVNKKEAELGEAFRGGVGKG